MSKNKRFEKLNSPITPIIVVFGLLMLGLGILFFIITSRRLDNYVSTQVAAHAAEAAAVFSVDIAYENRRLAEVADILKRRDFTNDTTHEAMIDYIERALGSRSNAITGLLDHNGRAIYGKQVSLKQYDGILASLRGTGEITNTNAGVLLFTYPVMRGDNVRFVLYELITTGNIFNESNLSIYDGSGHSMIATRDGDVVIPFPEGDTPINRYLSSPLANAIYTSLSRQLDVTPAVATLSNTPAGKYFFYCARVEDTDFVVVGAVKKEAAYGNIIKVPYYILSVFWGLTVIIIILAIYLVSITERIQESEELRRAKRLAEEASNAKSSFLANMSHEIRTPITAILGLDEMILRETRDASLRRYALGIRSSGSTLMSLINDILDFSRIEAGKMVLEPDEYRFSNMVSDLLDMILPRSSQKGLEFNISVNDNIPRVLYGDNIRLKQIILNLLTNAVKYTPEGSVTLAFDYERIDDVTVSLKVTVSDTGIGIHEEDIKRLFNKFERFDEKRNRTIEGAGLGMNIVQQLLEMMNARLSVDSVYGKGSTFSFAVAQEVVDWTPVGPNAYLAAEETEPPEDYTAYFTARDASILIVDDTEMNLMVISNLLKKTGLAIDTASSGEMALAMTRKKNYDVLLIDHRMPGMDGMEMLKILREDESNPNHNRICIALTANAMAGARDQYIAAGFDEYLTKPVESLKLEMLLADLLPRDKVTLSASAGSERKGGNRGGVGDSDVPQDGGVGSVADSDASQDGVGSATDGGAVDASDVSAERESSTPLECLEREGYINIENGIGYAGSLEMYTMAVQFFRKSINDKITEIEGYYSDENWDDYMSKVHGLKSTARMIGADSLSEMARLLEMAADKRDIEFIHAHHRETMDFYRSYEELLGEV